MKKVYGLEAFEFSQEMQEILATMRECTNEEIRSFVDVLDYSACNDSLKIVISKKNVKIYSVNLYFPMFHGEQEGAIKHIFNDEGENIIICNRNDSSKYKSLINKDGKLKFKVCNRNLENAIEYTFTCKNLPILGRKVRNIKKVNEQEASEEPNV